MKAQIIAVLSLAMLFTSCGNHKNTDSSSENVTTTTTVPSTSVKMADNNEDNSLDNESLEDKERLTEKSVVTSIPLDSSEYDTDDNSLSARHMTGNFNTDTVVTHTTTTRTATVSKPNTSKTETSTKAVTSTTTTKAKETTSPTTTTSKPNSEIKTYVTSSDDEIELPIIPVG